MTLHADVKLLVDVVNDLDADGPTGDLDSDLIALAMLEEARTTLGHIARVLTDKLAQAMPERRVTVMGAGTFERSKKKDRTQWDKEALLSAVQDSRLFNPNTGELVEETPLEKVLKVYNLPAPRITALKDRGIDADQFCHTEDAGYSIRLYTT